MAFLNKPPSRKNSSFSQGGDAEWFHRTSIGFSNPAAPHELAIQPEGVLQTRNNEWTEFLIGQTIEPTQRPRESVDDSTWFKIRTRDLREFSLDHNHHAEIELGFQAPKDRGETENFVQEPTDQVESLIRRNFSRSLSEFLNLSETASYFGQPLTRAVSQAEIGKFAQFVSELNKGSEPKPNGPQEAQADPELDQSPFKGKRPDFTKVCVL